MNAFEQKKCILNFLQCEQNWEFFFWILCMNIWMFVLFKSWWPMLKRCQKSSNNMCCCIIVYLTSNQKKNPKYEEDEVQWNWKSWLRYIHTNLTWLHNLLITLLVLLFCSCSSSGTSCYSIGGISGTWNICYAMHTEI